MLMKYLLVVYFINAVLLINHEIESAYWREWRLFKIPGGITTFVLLHFPVLTAILYGLLLLERQQTAGLVFSGILAVGGLFAFCFHMYHIKKGRREFRLKISFFLLYSMLLASLIQLALTIRFLV